MSTESVSPRDHPFIRSPHYTLISLSFPVLLSLIAEPLTGLVDTAFVSKLGAPSLAALGVGTISLSSVFWIFNFLGIGTQTEIAQSSGKQEHSRATELSGMALLLSGLIGVFMIMVGLPGIPPAATWMGASGEIHDGAVTYMRIRLFGTPAVLMTIAAFGVLRGLQDMKTPLRIAVSINVLNIILDPIMIFGLGPFPALGIAGAAIASTVSQWLGVIWAIRAIFSRLGFPDHIRTRDIRRLIRVGGDLFLRTGTLTGFLLLTTRAATRIGADAGAAHQAIRQVWLFTALFLDAYAIAGQSMVGYFLGAEWRSQARHVAFLVCGWSLGTGVVLGLGMWIGQNFVAGLLVPPTALDLFFTAWIISAIFQPINALSFATDGIHWGTGDYRFLRNAMIAATACGAVAIFLLDESNPNALNWIWIITGSWITIRAAFGIARIWPGIGSSPLAGKSEYL